MVVVGTTTCGGSERVGRRRQTRTHARCVRQRRRRQRTTSLYSRICLLVPVVHVVVLVAVCGLDAEAATTRAGTAAVADSFASVASRSGLLQNDALRTKHQHDDTQSQSQRTRQQHQHRHGHDRGHENVAQQQPLVPAGGGGKSAAGGSSAFGSGSLPHHSAPNPPSSSGGGGTPSHTTPVPASRGNRGEGDSYHNSGFSYVYHQRMYGISLGTTILSCAVLSLVAFVIYAKHRSAMVYRAREDYGAAYDRMLSIVVR